MDDESAMFGHLSACGRRIHYHALLSDNRPFRVGAIDYPILQKAMKELRKTYLIKD